jgi:hypothetical protein
MSVSKQWPLIRSWLRRTYNKEVLEFFRDLPADVDPDNSTGRSTTKAVCLIGANDSQGIAETKRQNFRELKEKAGLLLQQNHEFMSLPGDTIEGFPQIQLWFEEKYSTAKLNRRQVIKARVGFRVMEEDWSLAEATNLARKIHQSFATPIFRFERGKYKWSYRDKKKGYEFILCTPTEAEAKRVITATMALKDDTPDWKKLTQSKRVEERTTTETVRVLGKPVKLAPDRVETTVAFRYAIAKIPPLTTDYPLVDTSLRYWNALYRGEVQA